MFTQLIRIGRDAELRTTQTGKSVCAIAGVYDIGWGDKKRPQWIECALWGKQAESLAQYLVKGQQAMVTLDDVEVDEWERNGKSGAKLKARVVDLKLCGSKPEQRQAPQQQAAHAPASADDFDDDIPF